MKINEIISFLESWAPLSLQESYDNAGLLTGNSDWDCSGILCCLDATEDLVAEAVRKKCNLIVAHHPIIFSGLKKINGKNYVEKTIIRAIKQDIAIYAIHTNLDNRADGVNGKIASLLGLQGLTLLQTRENTLKKLYTYVPVAAAEALRNALFVAGGGVIGNYSECSFNTDGTGTFRPGSGTNPYVGEPGSRHHETETRVELIFPAWKEKALVAALKQAHPYEEVAYDLVTLGNSHPGLGAGLVGELPEAMEESAFLDSLKTLFRVPVIRHSALLNRLVKRVALCGGAGSFLVSKALLAKADAYITADMKYHEFFDANGDLLICDVGHYESEQYTTDLLQEVLQQKFPTFAVLKTEVITNPVHYH